MLPLIAKESEIISTILRLSFHNNLSLEKIEHHINKNFTKKNSINFFFS